MDLLKEQYDTIQNITIFIGKIWALLPILITISCIFHRNALIPNFEAEYSKT